MKYNSHEPINELYRLTREARHFAPANKEWVNSGYNFNKSYAAETFSKDAMADKIIKSYFSSTPKPIKSTRSKRSRDLAKRSSSIQYYATKPEIKHTNDKSVITVYTHDVNKQASLRKLFVLRRWLNKNIDSYNLENKKRSYLNHLIRKVKIKGSNKFNQKLDWKSSNLIFKRFAVNYKVKSDITRKFALLFYKKRHFINSGFIYLFLNWVFSIFKLKCYTTTKMLENRVKVNKRFLNEVIPVTSLIIKKKSSNKRLKYVKPLKVINIKGAININTLKKINLILLQFLTVNIIKVSPLFINSKINKFNLLFNKFKHKYLLVLIQRYLYEEMFIIKYLTEYYTNKTKLNSYLPVMKNFLSKVYNKKIKLNIVNLKYLHLSSELYSEIISLKLRDRNKSLITILRKSFGLVSTFKPRSLFVLYKKDNNNNYTMHLKKTLSTFYESYKVLNGDILNKVFSQMFRVNKLKRTKKSLFYTSIKSILCSLKYKWVTGLRVEAKGRLSKRYSAGRSVFKYKYLGTLKNLEHLKNVENNLYSPSVFMLRSDVRPNTQYSSISSKRRIGAFGIKGWISSS